MPIFLGMVKDKYEKCPNKMSEFCPLSNALLETQTDKLALCAPCPLFKPKY